jgi:hypothetical protein
LVRKTLGPGNKEQASVCKKGQSNCGTNCLQRRWRLSPVNHIVFGKRMRKVIIREEK